MFNAGTARVTDTRITANGPLGDSVPHQNLGGGLENAGTLTMTGSTVDGNQAAIGGGLLNTGIASLTDCTVAGNSATGGGSGIFNSEVDPEEHVLPPSTASESGALTLINCTVALNNGADGAGLTMAPGHDGVVTLTNSIFARNIFNSLSGTVEFDVDGTVADATNCLFGTNDGQLLHIAHDHGGNRVGTPDAPIDPKFDPAGLADNFGPTPTIALLPNSPVIDAGLLGAGAPIDQRGLPREPAPDIGAFEFLHAPIATTTTVTASSTLPGFGRPVTFTARVALGPVGAPMTAGTVTFSDGTTDLGTVPLGPDGTAAFTTTSTLALGPHAITARFASTAAAAGFPGAQPSQSAPLAVTVTPPITLVTAPQQADKPVSVFDGPDGHLVRSIDSLGANSPLVVAAGDVNGDGRADIVAVTGPGVVGQVAVIDGGTGATITPPTQEFADDELAGLSVAVGDVRGDGQTVALAATGPGDSDVIAILFLLGRAEGFFARQVFGPADRGGVSLAVAVVNGQPLVVVGSGPGIPDQIAVLTGGRGTSSSRRRRCSSATRAGCGWRHRPTGRCARSTSAPGRETPRWSRLWNWICLRGLASGRCGWARCSAGRPTG